VIAPKRLDSETFFSQNGMRRSLFKMGDLKDE